MIKEFKSIIEKYTPLGGSTIEEAINTAKRRAKEKDCVVLIRFNSVEIFVDRRSDCGFLKNYYSYKCHIHKYENALMD